MTENQEKQLLNVIRDTQMRSETLEIKDPEMVKIVMDEIDRLTQQQMITSVVAQMLKALPTNKLVQCFEAVQGVLRIGQSRSISTLSAMEAPRKRFIVISATIFFILSIVVILFFLLVVYAQLQFARLG